jgi:hypothetical protein
MGVLIVRNVSESSVEIRSDLMGSPPNRIPEQMVRHLSDEMARMKKGYSRPGYTPTGKGLV